MLGGGPSASEWHLGGGELSSNPSLSPSVGITTSSPDVKTDTNVCAPGARGVWMLRCFHPNARSSSAHAGTERDTRSTYLYPPATRYSGCTQIADVCWPLESQVTVQYQSFSKSRLQSNDATNTRKTVKQAVMLLTPNTKYINKKSFQSINHSNKFTERSLRIPLQNKRLSRSRLDPGVGTLLNMQHVQPLGAVPK